jgi:hypothetical protein
MLGGVVGLAALSKLSGLLLVALAAITACSARRGAPTPGACSGTAALLISGTALMVAGWWYLRNWLLFGDPLLLSVMFAGVPPQAAAASMAELLALAPGIWRSMWAVFGWFNVLAAPWVYWLFTLLGRVVDCGVAHWMDRAPCADRRGCASGAAGAAGDLAGHGRRRGGRAGRRSATHRGGSCFPRWPRLRR